jgi:flagellin
MVVQHNMQAMNANRMLNVTTSSQAKSTEKLSSGYRINRAADDAAGLSISEKMRKQIRGLDQASTNAEDGVSAVQTAEGALTEVHSMLQRMNELAVQAANGTNSVSDRDAIQAEISQLTTEIDRVAQTTKFNETYLLKGSSGTTTEYLEGRDAGLDYTTFVDGESVATMKIDLTAGNSVTVGGQVYNIIRDDAADKLESIQKTVAGGTEDTVVINGTTYTKGTNANNETIYDAGTGTTYLAAELAAKIQDGTTVTIGSDTYVARDYSNTLNKKASDIEPLIETALVQANSIGVTKTDYNATIKNTSHTGNGNGDKTVYTFEINKGQKDVDNALTFNLHVGADADMTNKINVNIETMNAAGLGLTGLNVSDDSGIAATYAIDVIAEAISTVSAQRSALGAVQNRLEHTINNLDNVVENTTSAESRIRDTDMAEEMVEYSKNNILAQAGQSMLAQANQSTQGVLSLLQG